MSDDLSDLYQEVILDHSRSPRNFRTLEGANRLAEGHNPLCGDHITVFLKLEGDVIREISFQGSGCAISKASASIMTETLKGKTKAEANKIFHRFHDLIMTGKDGGQEMGKLAVMAGVHKFPNRIKCAILPWHAVEACLEGKKDPISTE
jgi:nitrogen fixation protein NifU and related proteins